MMEWSRCRLNVQTFQDLIYDAARFPLQLVLLIGLLGLSDAKAQQELQPSPKSTASTAFSQTQIRPIHGLVVRSAPWSPALQKWKKHRAAQGIQIAEIDAELGQQEILVRIRRYHQQHANTLRFLVLAGDVDPRFSSSIPTFYKNSEAMVQFGGDPRIATDNPYVDLDGDELPDLAVGRIPVDSQTQLSQYLNRVLEYEQDKDFSSWRRDVHVIAGVGGFGALADSMIEMTTRRFLADRIPGWSRLSMTQASVKSHFCPDPWRFSETSLERLNQGGMFWVYIGHGHLKTLDYIRAEGAMLPILNTQHLPAVKVEHPPVAVFLACYTGAFDAIEDSLAERLVLLDHGPIAALAASRVSGPYGLAMLSNGLLDGIYEEQVDTLGEVVLRAKRRMLTPAKSGVVPASDVEVSNDERKAAQLELIGGIASTLSPSNYDLRQERLEHVWQMQILGDPMLHLCYPTAIELNTPDRVVPGDVLNVQGTIEEPAKVTVELAIRRDKVRRELDGQGGDLKTLSGRDAYQQRYQVANDRVLTSASELQPAGNFDMRLQVPVDLANGRYSVRLFAESANGFQVGYSEVSVRRPR